MREELVRRIEPDAPLRLDRFGQIYRCQVGVADRVLEFDGDSAEAAYAIALQHALENEQPATDADER